MQARRVGGQMRCTSIVVVTVSSILAVSVGSAAAESIRISAPSKDQTIFSNGALTNPEGRCDSGPEACGGSGTWTIYDDFSVSSAAVMTGFTFADLLDRGELDTYRKTTWSVWSSSPIDGTLEDSGAAIGTITAGSGDQFFVAVTGLNVPLEAHTLYWLGSSNVMAGAGITSRSLAAGNNLPIYIASDGATNRFELRGDTYFSVIGNEAGGTTVPEPSSWVLLVTGAGLVVTRTLVRRRELVGAHPLPR
jgi:hypothetical protein